MDSVPSVLPVPVARAVPELQPKEPAYSWRHQGLVPTVVGWLWRLTAGVFFCFNILPLSFVTSVAAFGWLQRWVQAVVLRGWWRQSPRRRELAFHEFCDSLGPNAPVGRPRWFWHERPGAYLMQPGGPLLVVARVLLVPVHSLLVNFQRGIQGLLATYLVMGWGCLLMLLSWYFGWHNSFHKGYEDFWIGPMLGTIGGFVLLAAALYYVPMAQAHQAASGTFFSFFQFGVVRKLIHARMTGYACLLAGIVLLSAVLEGLRVAVLGENFGGNLEHLTPEEGFAYLQGYLLGCTAFLFPSLVVLRGLSALIYRSAVLKALQRGTVTRDDLPPTLTDVLKRLELLPAGPPEPAAGPVELVRGVVAWKYRTLLGIGLYLLLALFVVRFYVGYFLVFNDFRGPLNHPVVQFPCIDSTPWHLLQGYDEDPPPRHPKY